MIFWLEFLRKKWDKTSVVILVFVNNLSESNIKTGFKPNKLDKSLSYLYF